jgi:hypothetical protein
MADDNAKNATDLGILKPGETIPREDNLGERENGKKDRVDFFKFTQEKEGDVNIVVDGLANNQNVDLFLRTANGKRLLDKSVNPGNQEEFISFEDLDAGEYVVQVKAKGRAKTEYNLSFNAAAEKGDDYDDWPGKPVGVLNDLEEPFSESNRIGFGQRKNRDTHDYYNFELTERSEVTISLDDLIRDANVELQNFFTDTLLTLNGKKNEPELGSVFLDPGSYLLDVRPKSNNRTQYTLSVDAKVDILDPDNKPPGVPLGNLLANEEPLYAVGDIGITEGRRDTRDWYNFQVNEDSDVRVLMDGLDGDANLTVWELKPNGKKLRPQGSSKNKDRRSEEFNSFLEEGNYGIEITTRGTAKTGYYLQVDAQPTNDDLPLDDPGDLGTLTFDTTERDGDIGDFFGENFRDTQDWYKFTVDGDEKEVVLNLDGITEDADIELYKNTNRKSIADSSKTRGQEGKQITQVLDAGEYFVKVVPKGGGNTDYLLEARINETEPSVETFEVGVLNELDKATYNAPRGAEIGQNVGATSRNEADLYNFSLTERSSVSVNLNQLKDDASLRILDADGNEVAKSDKPRNRRERIESEPLAPGDYTVEVAAVGSDETTYRLKMVANVAEDIINVFPEEGQGPVVLDAVEEYSERDDIGNSEAGGRNLLDVHNFTLNSESDFILDLEDFSANINVEVKNSSGDRVLNPGFNPGSTPEKIEGVLPAGDYAVNIFAVDPEPTEYLVVMSAEPAASGDGNDTQETASALAIPGEVDGEVGEGSDGFDYYKFSLTESSEVSLLMSGLDRNVDLKLFDASGSSKGASEKSGRRSEKISAELTPGDYYVAVEAKSGRSDYTLVANADAITGDPDGTIDTATDLGAVGDPLVNPVKDKINDSKGDNSDFYKISAAGGDRLIATLDNLNGNADLLLLDASGTEIAGTPSSGTDGEVINYTFADPGDYYLQVVAGASGVQTSYTLNL